jgi:hypothetical protein
VFEWNGNNSGGTGMSKKQIKMAAKDQQFSDFDVNKKLKKGGKSSNKSFKSKSKFKRKK